MLYFSLSGFAKIALLHPHALDDAGLQRLNRLRAFAHDDAAGGHGHDIDFAERGPHEGDDEQRAHGNRGAAPGGRAFPAG